MKMLLVVIGLLLVTIPAAAQVADPPYEHPDAQRMAEFRAGMAMFGLLPPPIGWNCQMVGHSLEDMYWVEWYCEPDPAMVEQQRIDYLMWVQRITERGQEIMGNSLFRKR